MDDQEREPADPGDREERPRENRALHGKRRRRLASGLRPRRPRLRGARNGARDGARGGARARLPAGSSDGLADALALGGALELPLGLADGLADGLALGFARSWSCRRARGRALQHPRREEAGRDCWLHECTT